MYHHCPPIIQGLKNYISGARLSVVWAILLLGEGSTPCSAQSVLSITYVPAFTRVNITNINRFSFSGTTRDLFSKKRPESPSFGYTYGFNYSYRFKNRFSAGIGFLKTFTQSNSGPFFVFENSVAQVVYYHKYWSAEVPVRLQYSFPEKRITPVLALEAGVNIFEKFKVPLYTIDPETMERRNSQTETHFGIKLSLAKFSSAVSAGVRIKVWKHLSFSFLPEFRYYYGTFRITQCCSSFIQGNMWLLGLRTEANVTF